MKVDHGKTKAMVCGGITSQDGLSKSKFDTFGVCSLRLKANGCAGVKRVTPKFSSNSTCRRCEGNIGETVEQEEKLCDEVETVWDITYLGDRVSAGGGCEAAVTA